MSLNIKNQETCELARELADLTNDSMTGAITFALRERLDQVKRERDKAALKRDLRAIAERCAKKLRPGGPSAAEIVDSMYGEFGEPV